VGALRYFMTDEQIRKLSTQRLLKIFRMLRKSILSREPERNPDWDDEQEELELDRLKAELDTREHVPRKQRRMV